MEMGGQSKGRGTEKLRRETEYSNRRAGTADLETGGRGI